MRLKGKVEGKELLLPEIFSHGRVAEGREIHTVEVLLVPEVHLQGRGPLTRFNKIKMNYSICGELFQTGRIRKNLVSRIRFRNDQYQIWILII